MYTWNIDYRTSAVRFKSTVSYLPYIKSFIVTNIDNCLMDVFEFQSGEQVRHHDHAPLRKANSEALPQHAPLKRQTAVYYAEYQDSSDIPLTPSQKAKAFREKRTMSVPCQDTHSDVCILHHSFAT